MSSVFQTPPPGGGGGGGPVTLAGVADAGNSSVAPLGIAGVFTGAWKDVKDYTAVVVTFISDQGAAFNGITLQWSPDGANADVVDTYNMAFLGVGQAIVSSVRGRFLRVVYTNGGTAQGYFRLDTGLKQTTETPTSQTVVLLDQAGVKKAIVDSFGDGIGPQNRLLVDAALRLRNGGGTDDLARGDIANGLDVDVTRSALPTGAATQATLASLLAQLDVALSTRASQATVASILGQLDVALSTRLADATFTGRFPVAQALSEAIANPTATSIGAFLMVWDAIAAQWRRLPGFPTSADALGQQSAFAYPPVVAHLLGFNGASFDRLRSDTANGLDVDVTRSALPTGAATEATAAAILATTPALDSSLIDMWTRYQRKHTEIAYLEADDMADYVLARRAAERISQTDRRGSVGRGSTR